MRLPAGITAALLVSPLEAVVYNNDGTKASSVKKECEACQWAALHAMDIYHKGPSSTEDMTTSDWAQELATGCASSPSGSGANASQASESCALLQQKGGKAIAGALVDFVADGPEAAEWTMDTFDFQTALCTTYSDMCREGYNFASVEKAIFRVDASLHPMAVAVYRRGRSQAGMLPLEPTSVVPAGREVGFHAIANSLVLVDGFAWRLLPMVDMACPSHNDGDDSAICAVACHPKGKKPDAPGQVQSCKRAESACREMENCATVSLAPDGSHGRLKAHAFDWEDPRAVDLFLDQDRVQVYDLSENPLYGPSLPLEVPDPAARPPDGWDEEEDGAWEAPFVANTAALAASPPFIVTKAPVLEVKSDSHATSSSSSSAAPGRTAASAAYRFGAPSPAPAPWPTRDPHLSAEERARALADFELATTNIKGEADSLAPTSGASSRQVPVSSPPQDGRSGADEANKNTRATKKKKGKAKKDTKNNKGPAEAEL